MTDSGTPPRVPVPAWYVEDRWNPQPWAQPQRRRSGPPVRLLALLVLLLVLIAVAGHQGILPQWVPFRAALVGPPPAAPTVAYPVLGSDDLVTYLAASMIAQEDSIDVTYWANTDGIGRDGVFDAVSEAAIQNPYVFVTGWTYITSVAGVSVRPDYVYDAADAETRRAATARAVSVGLEKAGVRPGQSQAKVAKEIHDYVASVATYDFTAADAISAGVTDSDAVTQSQEAYGILVAGTAVCNGYAEAFQAMAQQAGLRTVVVTGEAFSGLTTGAHAWNRVFVDGAWRVVDVTWDDVDAATARSDYLLVPLDDPKLDSRSADRDWVVDSEVGEYGG